MKYLPRLVSLLLLTTAVSAQQGVLPDRVRAAADRITAEQLKRDLDFLASDELMGRNTPSPGFDRAAQYIAARLEKAGVTPRGDNGTYFQHYEMHESRVATGAASIVAGDRTLRFGDDFVIRSYAAPLRGEYPVVYVGHGWTVPGKNVDPYAGLDVKGKILLAHGPRALPKGIEIQQIGRVSVGANPAIVEAARRGAAGVIFIPQGTALGNWAQARTQNLVRRELVPGVPSAYAAAPSTALLLSKAATEAMLAGEQVSGSDMLAAGESADYPASFELKKRIAVTLEADTTVHRPYNVIGVIEGSDPALKNEYITVAAHLDGAVGTRTVDGDPIYNSADDNASGSAGTLAIAEQMAALRPKRSILFIWDSGEEQGLWGTRHFVANPPVPLAEVVAHFNIDMIGANRAPGSPDEKESRVTGPSEVYLIGPGALSTSAGALLDAVNGAYLGMRFNRDFDTAGHEFFYPRTDAGPFLERGVLTIGFTTGNHARYHLPADEARSLDPKKMEAISRTVFASLWAFADAAQPPRIDKPIPATVPRYR